MIKMAFYSNLIIAAMVTEDRFIFVARNGTVTIHHVFLSSPVGASGLHSIGYRRSLPEEGKEREQIWTSPVPQKAPLDE